MAQPSLDAQDVLALLETRGIEFALLRHPPLRTVADAKRLRGDIDAAHVKNLFLRDKKRNLILLTVAEDARVDLKVARHALGARGGLGFASDEVLAACLGVRPGAVTPLGLLNDSEGAVSFHLGRSVAESERIAIHPLVNDLTVVMRTIDLLELLSASGHAAQIVDADDLVRLPDGMHAEPVIEG